MGAFAALLVPTSGGTGDIDFGPGAKIELPAIREHWFRHHFDGSANKLLEQPPVRIFVMGGNRWRDDWEWPLKRTRYSNAYLRGGGPANGAGGDGRLAHDAPGDEPTARFSLAVVSCFESAVHGAKLRPPLFAAGFEREVHR